MNQAQGTGAERRGRYGLPLSGHLVGTPSLRMRTHTLGREYLVNYARCPREGNTQSAFMMNATRSETAMTPEPVHRFMLGYSFQW